MILCVLSTLIVCINAEKLCSFMERYQEQSSIMEIGHNIDRHLEKPSSVYINRFNSNGINNSAIEEVRVNGTVALNQWLAEEHFNTENVHYELLYRASQIGCYSFTFHKLVDN